MAPHLRLAMLSWNVQGSRSFVDDVTPELLGTLREHDVDGVVVAFQELPFGHEYASFMKETITMSSRYQTLSAGILFELRREFTMVHHLEYGYLAISLWLKPSLLSSRVCEGDGG